MRDTPIANWVNEGLQKAEASGPPHPSVTHILLGEADLRALLAEDPKVNDARAFMDSMITGEQVYTINDVPIVLAPVMAPTYLVDVTVK